VSKRRPDLKLQNRSDTQRSVSLPSTRALHGYESIWMQLFTRSWPRVALDRLAEPRFVARPGGTS
jgi:hypothetical protein